MTQRLKDINKTLSKYQAAWQVKLVKVSTLSNQWQKQQYSLI